MGSARAVLVGQVWRARADRRVRRTVKVIEVSTGVAIVENTDTGRRSEVRLDRFRPNSNGYSLVSNPPPVTDTDGFTPRDRLAHLLALSNGTEWDFVLGGADEHDPYYRDADAILTAGWTPPADGTLPGTTAWVCQSRLRPERNVAGNPARAFEWSDRVDQEPLAASTAAHTESDRAAHDNPYGGKTGPVEFRVVRRTTIDVVEKEPTDA